ncbi:MAG: hypothetical protein FD161_424 [Limisphaerales bacterium]|nr:MAG: hypothetical protein FD161_424 [Limisphaerales bacterium]KAG0510329.1 MAG: hypothetical protein E1N63_424 [Limisphaerales bacterium]TXT51516.1 MAG: hypothetical protein FD140_1554 [Limisphaerales bacterium]
MHTTEANANHDAPVALAAQLSSALAVVSSFTAGTSSTAVQTCSVAEEASPPSSRKPARSLEKVPPASKKFLPLPRQQWTAFKNKARNRTGTSMGAFPVAPATGTPPAAVPAGIFKRTATLVARIKKHSGYTDAIGQALDIIGAEQAFDPNTLKPILATELRAGHPAVLWIKGQADALEFWVDRDNGTFVFFLAIDTVPDYGDTFALPAPGQTALWKYKAIYRIGDEQVGQWSDVVSQAVQGA